MALGRKLRALLGPGWYGVPRAGAPSSPGELSLPPRCLPRKGVCPARLHYAGPQGRPASPSEAAARGPCDPQGMEDPVSLRPGPQQVRAPLSGSLRDGVRTYSINGQEKYYPKSNWGVRHLPSGWCLPTPGATPLRSARELPAWGS